MLTLFACIMADHNLECQEYWKQEAIDAVIVDKIVRKGDSAPYIEDLMTISWAAAHRL
jgi:hypothetical protein